MFKTVEHFTISISEFLVELYLQDFESRKVPACFRSTVLIDLISTKWK